MFGQYASNLTPFVKEELKRALQARCTGDRVAEFSHLENAHVIGQDSTYWHVRIHCLMLFWAIRNRSPKEFAGQLFRIVGAATKTAMGLVPSGNTGGANVSPFKVMPIRSEHAAIIKSAKTGV